MVAPSRRKFLSTAAGCVCTLAGSLRAKPLDGLRIGAMDGILGLSSKPEALAMAKRLGLDGVQVTIGKPGPDGRLLLAGSEVQARFLAECKQQKMPIDATYLDILHVNCLKNDKLAQKWVADGIAITRALKARILMTVFFGKCSLAGIKELDYAGDCFKELAPEAEKAGVIIGFENTNSAEDNARVLDRVSSRAFKVYYDVGNSTNMGGFDVPKEIRWLGKDRICQFHFKDKGYLGEGKVDYPTILKAIADIGFEGYANLETSSPSGSAEEDTKRNLAFLRRQMAAL